MNREDRFLSELPKAPLSTMALSTMDGIRTWPHIRPHIPLPQHLRKDEVAFRQASILRLSHARSLQNFARTPLT